MSWMPPEQKNVLLPARKMLYQCSSWLPPSFSHGTQNFLKNAASSCHPRKAEYWSLAPPSLAHAPPPNLAHAPPIWAMNHHRSQNPPYRSNLCQCVFPEDRNRSDQEHHPVPPYLCKCVFSEMGTEIYKEMGL